MLRYPILKSAQPMPSESAVTAQFRIVFRALVAICSALTLAWVAVGLLIANPTGSQQGVIQGLSGFAGLGWGTLFGMLKGKTP
jgi:hypothetical protein